MRILDTNVTLAIRCPDCGRIKFHSISTFGLSPNTKLNLYCDCGSLEMSILLKDKKSMLADIPCVACDIKHTYKYSLKDILNSRVIIMSCLDTGFELCFMGKEKDVKDVVTRYQEDINMLLGELGMLVDTEEDTLKRIIKRIP